MNIRIKERLETSISKMVVFQPLYGVVFLHLNKIESEKLPTMGVGVTRRVDLALYYNPKFVESLTDQELRGVLKHEALHVLLHHLTRGKHFAFNATGFNIAADLAINPHIEGLPSSALLPKSFNLPNDQAAEWYYDSLKKEAEKNGLPSNGDGVGELAKGKGELIDDHSMWEDFDDDIVKEKVRHIAEQAIKEQEKKGWGTVPGKLAQEIIAVNKPVVNWKRETRYFINKLIMMGRKSTRMRPNRRYSYVTPGTKRDFRSRLLIAIDTSGSVSDKQLQDFLQEINGMIAHVDVDLIMFDTQVYGEPRPFTKKAKKLEVVGRGGTCFSEPIKMADELFYDGLIIFTDGMAPFPAKPKVRVLWAVCEQDKDVSFPYGKRVVIEKKRN